MWLCKVFWDKYNHFKIFWAESQRHWTASSASDVHTFSVLEKVPSIFKIHLRESMLYLFLKLTVITTTITNIIVVVIAVVVAVIVVIALWKLFCIWFFHNLLLVRSPWCSNVYIASVHIHACSKLDHWVQMNPAAFSWDDGTTCGKIFFCWVDWIQFA